MDQMRFCKSLWLDLCTDIMPDTTYTSLRFSQRTLYQLLDDATEAVDHLLLHKELTDGNTWHELVASDLPMEDKLQLLRFAKRFTPKEPVGNFDAFFEANSRLAKWEPKYNSHYIYHCWKESLRDLLSGYKRSSLAPLTNGTFLEAKQYGNTPVGKLRAMESFHPLYLWPLTGDTQQTRNLSRFNEARLVPKTYCKPRIICVEPEGRNVLAASVADGINHCLPDWCNYKRQERNRELARKGSIDNSLATIDLSQASDSVSMRQIREALEGTPLLTDLESVRAEYTKVPIGGRIISKVGKDNLPHFRYVTKPASVKMNMLASMGNRITYPMECAVFIAAVDVANHLCGIDDKVDHLPVNRYGCVGDDLIVPTEVAHTLMYVLESLGFLVNKEKSFFGDEFFRESCGGEYFSGVCVSTKYWPRKYLDMGINSLPSLIALQHELCKYPHANGTLVAAIRKIYPKITESRIGSEYSDLWSPFPATSYAPSSYKGDIPSEAMHDCEWHTVVSTSYSHVNPKDLPDASRLCYNAYLQLGSVLRMDKSGRYYKVPRDTKANCGVPQIRVRNVRFLR